MWWFRTHHIRLYDRLSPAPDKFIDSSLATSVYACNLEAFYIAPPSSPEYQRMTWSLEPVRLQLQRVQLQMFQAQAFG